MRALQRLPRIEEPGKYLEYALQKAAKRVGQFSPKGTALERAKKREQERVALVRDSLLKYLGRIHEGWPSLDELSEFYVELIEHVLSADELKHALGSLGYAQSTVRRLSREYLRLIGRQEDPQAVRRQVKSYLGRISSIFKRIAKELEYLERARKVMRRFPTIDPEEYTVAIAGFPNVGKSTLLSRLTSAEPEIKDYAFTTKGLNTGSFEHKFSRIQLVDTPGTLARGRENDIERLATITRRYAARLVVYVFDPTMQYPLEDQERLRAEVEQEGHPMVLYLSKTDVADGSVVERLKKDYPGILTSVDDVRAAVTDAFDDWN